ncbi:MAG: beta-galactosidase [Bacteroidota bacterium]
MCPVATRLLVLALGLAGLGCSEAVPAERDASDSIAGDSLPALDLGIAFPPVADAEQRAFTIPQLAALGVDHVRFSQAWRFREPERDRFVWRPLDARVADLVAAGIEVFLTLDIEGAPDWLASLSPAEQEAEFRAYVRALLDRLGADLAWIQYGNEWNAVLDPGEVDAFVRLANVLADEVARLPEAERPRVALGSVSIGGLSALALLQGRIENVVFEGGPLYTEAEIAAARAAGPETLDAFRTIVGSVRYDAVDLHLYDDVWNWPTYRAAVEKLLAEAGRDPAATPVVVSEFGGPHPTLEPGGEAFQARRVEAYVRALARLDVERAYFFKLVEEPGAPIAHPNSFLIDADLERRAAFDVIARVPAP